MATSEERLPQKAIEQNCEVIYLVDWLARQKTLQRNEKYAQALRQIRAHVVRSNTYVCLAWFPADHVAALDVPPLDAA